MYSSLQSVLVKLVVKETTLTLLEYLKWTCICVHIDYDRSIWQLYHFNMYLNPQRLWRPTYVLPHSISNIIIQLASKDAIYGVPMGNAIGFFSRLVVQLLISYLHSHYCFKTTQSCWGSTKKGQNTETCNLFLSFTAPVCPTEQKCHKDIVLFLVRRYLKTSSALVYQHMVKLWFYSMVLCLELHVNCIPQWQTLG